MYAAMWQQAMLAIAAMRYLPQTLAGPGPPHSIGTKHLLSWQDPGGTAFGLLLSRTLGPSVGQMGGWRVLWGSPVPLGFASEGRGRRRKGVQAPPARTALCRWLSGTGEGGDAAVYPFPTLYGYHPGDCQSQRLRPPSRTWKPQHPTSTFFSRSEEREGLLDQHLRPCLSSIFHLVPAQKMDSQHALLDAQVSAG